MKKALTIIMILLLSLKMSAQVDYGFGHGQKTIKSNIPIAGVKGGLTSYNMSFSDKDYAKLPGKNVTTAGFGIFVEYPLQNVNGLSIGAELLMVEKGYSKEFNARPNGVNVKKIEQINAKYLDFRIPFSYRFIPDRRVNPYVFVVPDLSFCFGGTQKHEFPDDSELPSQSVDLSKSDAVLAQTDLSIVAGIGLRFNIPINRNVFVLKIDGAYNFGLKNVKSQAQGDYANVHAWYSEEKEAWTNKGFELMLSIGIPLIIDNREGACKSWR